MSKIVRALSGALLGAAAVSALPATASAYAEAEAAAGGFCDETATYVVCCATDSANKIINCNYMKKPS